MNHSLELASLAVFIVLDSGLKRIPVAYRNFLYSSHFLERFSPGCRAPVRVEPYWYTS